MKHLQVSPYQMALNKVALFSPLLFSLYIDELFSFLKQSGLGCHVRLTYAGAFGYADGIALVAPSISSLKQMISTCENLQNVTVLFSILQKRSCCVLS